jgi:DNA invertase Pin-like site-specific DNA recombinase
MKTTSENQGQTKAPKVCFSYIRFSSKIQSKGDSERRQGEIAPRIAKENGWILREDLNEFDLGLSAYHRENLGGKGSIPAIITGIKSGKIPKGSVMIIEAFDRLTRTDIDEAMPLLWELLGAGLEIYIDRTSRHLTKASLKDPVELTMALFELKGSYEYSAKLSKRVGEAWKQKKARAADGVKVSRMAPAWLDAHTELAADGKPVITDFTPNEKANTVRRIFNSYAAGKGVRTIMRELNNPKHPAATFGKGAQNKGAGWSNTHLRRLLSFRGVIGEYQPCNQVGNKRIPDGPPIADYYPPIVDKSTFYKVQEILAKQTHTGGCKRHATNLFTGLMKCVKCGGSMVIKQTTCKHGRYRYTSLVCSNALRGNGCDYNTIQYSWVERAILTTLWLKVLPVMAETDTRQEQLAEMEGELKDVRAKLKIWADAIDSGEAKPAIAMQKLNSYETKEAALKRQIESLSATISENPLTGWEQVEPTIDNRLRLQAILASEIDSLTIDADKRTATLTLKESKGRNASFDLAWENNGANGRRQVEGNTRFLLRGEQQAYLDQVLVWKSAQNISLRGLKIKVVDTDYPLVFGVEIEPNKIAVAV